MACWTLLGPWFHFLLTSYLFFCAHQPFPSLHHTLIISIPRFYGHSLVNFFVYNSLNQALLPGSSLRFCMQQSDISFLVVTVKAFSLCHSVLLDTYYLVTSLFMHTSCVSFYFISHHKLFSISTAPVQPQIIIRLFYALSGRLDVDSIALQLLRRGNLYK